MRRTLSFVLLLAACSEAKDDAPPNTTTDPGTLHDTDTDTDADADADADADVDADTDADTDTDTDADTDTDTGMPMGLDIVGSYTDVYGSEHEITETDWTFAYPGYAADTFAIHQYDNVQMYVVAENGPANAYFAGMWSRFDWVWEGKDLYYCQTAYAEASEADALAIPASDDTAPASGGCGAYDLAWTLLTP